MNMTDKMIDAFYGATEVFPTGTIHNIEAGISAALAVAPKADLAVAPQVKEMPQPEARVLADEDAIRGEGYAAGIAMSVAFLIRDCDRPSIALEWWRASGLTLEQCERANVDDYDIAPIRAAIATTEANGHE